MKHIPLASSNPARPQRSLALLLPVLLAACGGGGGDGTAGGSTGGGGTGGDAVADAPVVVTGIAFLDQFFVQSFDAFESAARALVETDARYTRQDISWYQDDNGNGRYDPATEPLRNTYPLLSSGVHYAHAAGLTGAGAVLSIIDEGFRTNHEAFAGRVVDAQMGLASTDHGTQVASVAAGRSASMIGMAPGASLAFGSYATGATRADATRRAEALGAVAQNNSWGFQNSAATQASYNATFGNASGLDYLSALRSYARTGVVIFSADNEFTRTEAGLMPALPLFEPGLQAGWLAVVNADAELVGDDVVAAQRISSACLEAAPWCLAAEGTWESATAGATNSYQLGTGTSFAAPMVSGAMAILAEAFPTLTPHQLRIRLLASADNSFAGFTAAREIELVPGFSRAISDEWGHGFLDVKAALLPIGRTTATLADGTVYDLSEPLAVEGLATGDAVARALVGIPVAVDDALSARFEVAADSLVARRSAPSLGRDLQSRWDSRRDFGCCGTESWFPGSRTLRAGGDGTILEVALPGNADGTGSAGLMIGRDFVDGPGGLALRVGIGHDDGQLLPRWQAAGGSTILAGELAVAAAIGPGTALELTTGIGGSDSGIAFNTASAALVSRGIFGAGDRLSLSVGLPVAVSSGSSQITLPVVTMSAGAQAQSIDVNLAPERREMRVGLEYQYPVAGFGNAVIALAHAENRGNVAGQRDTGLFIGFRARF